MLGIVFEMIGKEFQSNQKVFASVCNKIADNFPEVYNAVKTTTESDRNSIHSRIHP